LKTFSILSIIDQIIILIELVIKYPRQVGKFYAQKIYLLGLGYVDSKEVNRILYKYESIFIPNLNEKKVPAWTTIFVTIPVNIREVIEKLISDEKITAYGREIIIELIDEKKIILDEEKFWNNFKLYDWQKKSLKYWKENNYIGYCVASRKTGKSYLAKRIAFYHCYSNGPVVVVLNTLKDIDTWFKDLSELKEQFDWDVNILRNDLSDQREIERDSILLVTKHWLVKVPLIIDNTLIIFDNIELKEFKNENFNKIKYRFSVYISNPENSKVISYFNKILIEYSFTDGMLEDIIQEFSLKFSLLPITVGEKEKFDKLETRITGISTESDNEWKDYLSIRDKEKSKQFPIQILIEDIDELLSYSQRIKSKFDYFLSLIESFSNYTKIVIFCENPKVIQSMFGPLINKSIDYIVYSIHEDLHYISRSPHEWQSQKVLITDHIKFFSNFNFDYIDYVLIFGTLGNSSRLIQKLEAVFNTRTENKKLLIDILCAEGTIEDPYKYSSAYEVFKDYRSELKIDLPVTKKIEETKIRSVESIIDLSMAKILVIYPKGDKSILSLNETLKNVLNITESIIDYIEDISITEIVDKVKSGIYSDLYIETILSKEQTESLYQIYEFDHSIMIKIFKSNKLTLGRLISFILNSQKYKFLNQKGNEIT